MNNKVQRIYSINFYEAKVFDFHVSKVVNKNNFI